MGNLSDFEMARAGFIRDPTYEAACHLLELGERLGKFMWIKTHHFDGFTLSGSRSLTFSAPDSLRGMLIAHLIECPPINVGPVARRIADLFVWPGADSSERIREILGRVLKL